MGGGAEKCLALLLERLPRDRFAPTVAMRCHPRPFTGAGRLETLCRQWQIDARRVDLKWWVRDWQHDAAFAHGLERRVDQIARIIAKQQIDLVVTNTSAVVEGALAARHCGVPHVWHVLEMLSQDPVLRPFLPLGDFYDLLRQLSRRIIVVSRAVKDEITRFCPAAAIDIVHTGLPLTTPRPDIPSRTQLLGLPNDRPVVTFVGLLSARKGIVDLVETARRVVAKMPRAQFVLVGRDGGERGEALRRIAAGGLKDNVRLLGQRGDVPDILARSDLFVLPALSDPLPVAVLEAMSAGLPVVATRSGGAAEMVIDGVSGRLVPVGDSDALAAAILDVLGDQARRREMGRRSREHFAAHFSQEAYVAHFCRVLDEVAQGERPAADNSVSLIAQLQAAALARREAERRRAPLRVRLRERALTLAYRLQLIH